METVFDHNITEEEWKATIGSLSKTTYSRIMDQESAYQDIATLFFVRGDIERAKEYANKLSSPLDMYDLYRTWYHP